MPSGRSDARNEAAETEPAPAGSADAEVERLFRAEHRRLLRALYLLTGGDRAEAEDLMQEAFVRVLQRWDRIRRMDDPTGYLYRTAMNAFRSRWRRRGVERLRRPTPVTPPDPIQAAEDRDAILRALREVPPRQRLALVLTEFLDLRPPEAAAVLGVEEVTARSLASQARARIRRALELADE
ncbi:MAG: sigma-70 family RNA polymerase sigma factor [Actinomycetota bacterium]|nr:sigma-70 family RNA polymerase sigma factor [Actinomycetota bacterium]